MARWIGAPCCPECAQVNRDLVAFDNYSPLAGATAASNVLITSTSQLSASEAVNSVLIRGNGINLGEIPSATGVGTTLTVGTATSGGLGGILDVGLGNTISADDLFFNLNEGTFFVDGDTLTVTSDISGGITAGAGITKGGPGILALAPIPFTTPAPGNVLYVSNYTGTTAVSDGTLNISSQAPLGNTGAVIVGNGTTLQLQNNVSLSLPGITLTVGGSGVNGQGALQNVGGTNSILVGTMAMSASTVVSAAANSELVLNGVVTGGGDALTKVGVGVLELTGSASNTYNGATSVTEGTLLLGMTGPTAVAIPGALNIGDGYGELVVPNNVQLVTTASTSGSFTLAFSGQTTGSIAYNALPSQVQIALQSLSTIGFGNVVVQGTPGNYQIVFTGTFASLSSTMPILSVASTTNLSSTITAGLPNTANDDVQVISVPGTTGSFTLAFSGQTVGTFAYNASPAQLQAALQGLPSIGTNNVLVAGTSGSYEVVFVGGTYGNIGQSVPTLQQVNSYNDDVQTLTVAGTSGTYQLAFGASTTGSISATASAGTIATAINNLASVLTANITVLVTGTPGSYNLVFTGSDAGVGTTVQTLTPFNISAGLTVTAGQANTPNSNVQLVSISGIALPGSTFTLTFDGETTPSIPYNASTSTVQADVQNLPAIGANNAVVYGSPGSYSIVLVGSLVNQSVNTVSTTISAAGNAGPVVSIVGTSGATATTIIGQAYPSSFAGADQVQFVGGLADTSEIGAGQTVTLSVSGVLNLGGQNDTIANLIMTGGQVQTGTGILTISNNITYNPGSGASISGFLNLPGNSTILVNPGEHETLNGGVQEYDLVISAQISGGGFTKTGAGALLVNNPNNSFDGASSVQTITYGTTGGFQLVFNGQTTTSISIPATPATIQMALQALTNIGTGNVTVAAVNTTLGFSDAITFTGTLGNEFISPLIIAPSPLGATASVAQTILGGGTLLNAGILGVGTNGATLLSGSGPTPLGVASTPFIINNNGATTATVWADSGNLTISNPLEFVSVGTNAGAGTGTTTAIAPTIFLGGRRDFGNTYSLDFNSTTSALLASSAAAAFTSAAQAGTLSFAQPAATVIETDDPSTFVEIDSNLGELSPGHGITKQGLGTLILTGNNSYTGTTAVSQGILSISNGNALGAPEQSATQLLAVEAVVLNDTFTISFGGATITGVNNSSGNAGSIQQQLQALSSIGGVGGTVTVSQVSSLTVSGITTTLYSVTFGGALADESLPLMTTNNSTSTGTITTVAPLVSGSIGVVVASGAELDISAPNGSAGITIGDEPLSFSGAGFIGNITGSGFGPGAVRNLSGNNTWGISTTPIIVGSGTTATTFNEIGADSGQLTFDGFIQQNVAGQGIDKVGPGTIAYGGIVSNSYTGTTTVSNGTLLLNKTSDQALNGPLVIGDNVTAATVVEATPEQLLDTAALAINSTGQLNVMPAQGSTPVDEVQSIGITATVGSYELTFGSDSTTQIINYNDIGVGGTTGTFTLSVDGVTTAALAVGTTAASVQAALNSGVLAGNESVSAILGDFVRRVYRHLQRIAAQFRRVDPSDQRFVVRYCLAAVVGAPGHRRPDDDQHCLQCLAVGGSNRIEHHARQRVRPAGRDVGHGQQFAAGRRRGDFAGHVLRDLRRCAGRDQPAVVVPRLRRHRHHDRVDRHDERHAGHRAGGARLVASAIRVRHRRQLQWRHVQPGL